MTKNEELIEMLKKHFINEQGISCGYIAYNIVGFDNKFNEEEKDLLKEVLGNESN